jgi:hypothetical protein
MYVGGIRQVFMNRVVILRALHLHHGGCDIRTVVAEIEEETVIEINIEPVANVCECGVV